MEWPGGAFLMQHRPSFPDLPEKKPLNFKVFCHYRVKLIHRQRHIMKRFTARLLATSVLVSAFGFSTAYADTLSQALTKAYQSSPTLDLNRAALRSLDEAVVQAAAGRRPTVTATADIGLSASDNSTRDVTDTYRAALNADLLLYDGGATDAAVAAARANVKASRATLASVEQTVLLNAIAAFVDVRRDERFVSLAQNNIKVISQQVAAARDRFEVGEVTRTDVSQAEARLASARSNLANNGGALERSKQSYIVAVGSAPGRLSAPPRLPKMPASLADAESIAVRQHPDILAAQANLESAEFDLARAKAGGSPTLSLGGSLAYSKNTQIFGEDNTTASVGLSGAMPLYQGGRIDSLERQARAILDRRRAELQNSARVVRQNVAIAWANLRVARASIQASQQEIRAARLAFEGVQEEAKLGARTTLDTLDAEQDVLNAESNLASARRDEYVAAYNLVAAMGLLNTEYLGLGIERYDPNVYYDSVNKSPSTSRRSSLVEQIRGRW
jgi:outer membrane protein